MCTTPGLAGSASSLWGLLLVSGVFAGVPLVLCVLHGSLQAEQRGVLCKRV